MLNVSIQRAALVALLQANLVACFNMTFNTQEAVPIPGRSTGEKTAFAQAFVTRPRLDKLKADVRKKFPRLTEDQVKGLYLKWNLFKPASGEDSVSIIVGLSSSDQNVDAAAVVAYCKELIEKDLRQDLK